MPVNVAIFTDRPTGINLEEEVAKLARVKIDYPTAKKYYRTFKNCNIEEFSTTAEAEAFIRGLNYVMTGRGIVAFVDNGKAKKAKQKVEKAVNVAAKHYRSWLRTAKVKEIWAELKNLPDAFDLRFNAEMMMACYATIELTGPIDILKSEAFAECLKDENEEPILNHAEIIEILKCKSATRRLSQPDNVPFSFEVLKDEGNSNSRVRVLSNPTTGEKIREALEQIKGLSITPVFDGIEQRLWESGI